jgi:transcriptional regulator with XRE-family HTH domain
VDKEQRQVTLRDLRVSKGKTQADIADSMQKRGRNVKQKHISDWENGKKTPSTDFLPDIAIAYESTLSVIFERLGYDLSEVPREVSE